MEHKRRFARTHRRFRRMEITDLPDEMLCEILAYLFVRAYFDSDRSGYGYTYFGTYPHDSARLTCKKWYNIMVDLRMCKIKNYPVISHHICIYMKRFCSAYRPNSSTAHSVVGAPLGKSCGPQLLSLASCVSMVISRLIKVESSFSPSRY